MEVSHGPLGGAERPFMSVLFTCWMSTTLDVAFPTRAAQIQDIRLYNWNNKTAGLVFSQQNTEHSVQAVQKQPTRTEWAVNL